MNQRHQDEKGISRQQSDTVANTWAALSIKREVLHDLLDEDAGFFDVSTDSDFERVEELRLFRPADL